MKSAVVLLSGGMDSATSLAIAKERGYEVVALTFDYGQRHSKEVECAQEIARRLGAKEHMVIPLPLGELLRSALTRESMDIPEGRSPEEMAEEIPDTYVPARNIIFLSIAASIAESRGAEAIFIAANSVDYSGYPDCTPGFILSFQDMLDIGTKAGKEGRGIKVEAPLLMKSKEDIVREAVRLRVPLELTWSCYKGGPKPCGRCDSCILRREGFAKAGIKDPLEQGVGK